MTVERARAVGTSLAILLVVAAATDAQAAARPRPRNLPDETSTPPVVPEAVGTGNRFDIRFDYEVVYRFLHFVDQERATAEELDRWVILPGNRELLRQGRQEGGLTPAVLAEAARVTLKGGAFLGPPTLGSLSGGDWEDLRQMARMIQSRETALIAGIVSGLSPYLPADRTLPPLRVFFHLGGSWDGRSTDAVYINLTLFQARGVESLPGLDALLVHELFHQAQAALLPGVEDYSSRQSALFTVLLRMQQEGTARHLEYRNLRGRVDVDALDRTNLQKYETALREAQTHAAVLAKILDAISANRLDQARIMTLQALQSGGPLYAVGHGMADLIERTGGSRALAETVPGGPPEFVRAYLAALPRVSSESLLPSQLPALIDDLERGYARDPVRATRARRAGLGLIGLGRLEDAGRELTRSIRIDPSDGTSAYNLACAQALRGRKRRALKWLEEAFDRGFNNYKHAATDEDLDSLHDEPEFEALLKQHGFDFRRRPAPGAGVSP